MNINNFQVFTQIFPRKKSTYRQLAMKLSFSQTYQPILNQIVGFEAVLKRKKTDY